MNKLLLMRLNSPQTNLAGEVRMRQRSSLCETSRRWCRPFSMPPKPARFKASHPGASSWSGGALVSKIWFGKASNPPGFRSLPHHHGEAETGAYVLSGRARIFWGKDNQEFVD